MNLQDIELLLENQKPIWPGCCYLCNEFGGDSLAPIHSRCELNVRTDLLL